MEEYDDSNKQHEEQRISLNIRVDAQKHMMLEKMRKTGFGMATTERNRSDVYNEMLGYGLQTYMLKTELGDRDFEQLWRLIHKINWQKLNIKQVEKLMLHE